MKLESKVERHWFDFQMHWRSLNGEVKMLKRKDSLTNSFRIREMETINDVRYFKDIYFSFKNALFRFNFSVQKDICIIATAEGHYECINLSISSSVNKFQVCG